MEACYVMANEGIKLVWNGEVTGDGTIESGQLNTDIAIPTPLGGSGEGANPKDLLVSSAATCYLTTLVSILQNRDIPVEAKEMHSDMEIGEDKSMTIIHQPRLTLSSDAVTEDKAAAEKAMDGANKACFIGKVLKNAGVTIELKPEVSISQS